MLITATRFSARVYVTLMGLLFAETTTKASSTPSASGSVEHPNMTLPPHPPQPPPEPPNHGTDRARALGGMTSLPPLDDVTMEDDEVSGT